MRTTESAMGRARLSGALLLGLALGGCASTQALEEEGIDVVSPAELHTLLAENNAIALDVNMEGFRKENGVVPGARLLSSEEFAADELPSDKSAHLVFYCTSRF